MNIHSIISQAQKIYNNPPSYRIFGKEVTITKIALAALGLFVATVVTAWHLRSSKVEDKSLKLTPLLSTENPKVEKPVSTPIAEAEKFVHSGVFDKTLYSNNLFKMDPKERAPTIFKVKDETIEILKSIDPSSISLTDEEKARLGLFTPATSELKEDSKNYLNRFQVVTSPITMAYNSDWKKYEKPNENQLFTLVSAAAINIGDPLVKSDFDSYKTADKKLDTHRYVEDMKKTFELSVQAFINISESLNGGKQKHFVVFPFGMGAFMRKLDQNDQTYQKLEDSYPLREALATAFTEVMSKYDQVHFHTCIIAPEKGAEINETDLNFAAFVMAAKKLHNQNQRPKLEFHLNGDATEVAQKLANKEYQVGLLNGSNAKRFGSFWENQTALSAIEENIFRRAGLPLIKVFCQLNRPIGTTAQLIEEVGGKVVIL